jgi:hypothetical protein
VPLSPPPSCYTLSTHKGVIRGNCQHDSALNVLAAEGAVTDDLRARFTHTAVAAGLRHRHPGLRQADHTLAARPLLGRQGLGPRTLAPGNPLKPRREDREAGTILRPRLPARAHHLVHGVRALRRLLETSAAAHMRRHRVVTLEHVVWHEPAGEELPQEDAQGPHVRELQHPLAPPGNRLWGRPPHGQHARVRPCPSRPAPSRGRRACHVARRRKPS